MDRRWSRHLQEAIDNALAQSKQGRPSHEGFGEFEPLTIGGVPCLLFPMFCVQAESMCPGASEPTFTATTIVMIWCHDWTFACQYGIASAKTQWIGVSSAPRAADLALPLARAAALSARKHPEFRARREAAAIEKAASLLSSGLAPSRRL